MGSEAGGKFTINYRGKKMAIKITRATSEAAEEVFDAAMRYGFTHCLFVEFDGEHKVDAYPREIEKIVEKHGKEVFQNIMSAGYASGDTEGTCFLLFLPLHLTLGNLKSIMHELGEEKNIKKVILKYVQELRVNSMAKDLLEDLKNFLKDSSLQEALKSMKSSDFSDSKKH